MPSSKRKILFIWPYVEWGGAQIHILGIIKLAKADWDISVILPEGSDDKFLQFLRDLDVPYSFTKHRLDVDPAPTIRRKLERQFNRIRSELDMLRAIRKYDLANTIVHVDTAPWQSWQFYTILSLLGGKTFITMHNGPEGGSALRKLIWTVRMRFLSKLKRFNAFAANRDTRDRLNQFFGEKFTSEMPVTYTCVDPIEIADAKESGPDRHELRKRFSIEEDRFVVLCVGQFIDRKGRWVYLDAAKELAELDPSVLMLWLAPNELSAEESKRIDDVNSESFKYIRSDQLGSDRRSILSFYSIADCFALPSYVEGLPIALLEAMASGLASISTNVNSIPEAIIDGETGLLIEPGDADRLAAAIVRLRTEPELRDRLSINGREHILANFDERVAAQITIDAYERCFADG